MPSSMKTPNLNLTQFVDADTPSWLTDYNNDMMKVDSFAMSKNMYDPQGKGTDIYAYADAVVPAGCIMPFAGATAPAGYLLADGAEVSRAQYSALFAAIGVAYGEGNGSTTFKIPNLCSRVAIGANASFPLGKSGGEEAHKLTQAEMPAHVHPTTIYQYYTIPGSGMFTGSSSTTASAMMNTGSAGGNLAHNNMQPYLALSYIIKY